jgi:hypothetical protein
LLSAPSWSERWNGNELGAVPSFLTIHRLKE